jgi:hypothetical protein
MACLSLTGLPLICNDGLIAGVQKLYMVANQDLQNVSGSTRPYVLSTNSVVNQISLKSTKKFVEIGQLKNTAGLTETGVFNDNGTSYSTVEMTLSLVDITAENQAFVSNVKGQEISALILSKTGKYYTVGLNGGMRLTAYTGGLGTADADQIGYTLTFSSADTMGIKLVETSVATGAIATA